MDPSLTMSWDQFLCVLTKCLLNGYLLWHSSLRQNYMIFSSKPRRGAVWIDSLRAFLSLCSVVCCDHPEVCAIRHWFRLLSSAGCMVHFCWLSGHASIRGNDLADSLSLTPHNHFFVQDFRSMIGSFVMMEWQCCGMNRHVASCFVWSLPFVVLRKLCWRVSSLGTVVSLTRRYLPCGGEEATVCDLHNASFTVRYHHFVCRRFSSIR